MSKKEEIANAFYIPDDVARVFVDHALENGQIGISALVQAAFDRPFSLTVPSEQFDTTKYERFKLRTVYLKAIQHEHLNDMAALSGLKPNDIITKAMIHTINNGGVESLRL